MRQFISFLAGAMALCLLLAACTQAPHPDAALATSSGDRPADARAESCYSKDVTPAVVETVTDQVLIQPAQIASDGSVIHPSVYKTVTRQTIVRERKEVFFEVPCPDLLTVDFIASLQRALQARGVYRGPVTGEIDNRTRRAIRAFQKQQGQNTGILTMDAARKLGLVAYVLKDGAGAS